jgi:hypothetical protein
MASLLVFWVVTPCALVGTYVIFHVIYLPASPLVFITQQTNVIIFTVVRTSNLIDKNTV